MKITNAMRLNHRYLKHNGAQHDYVQNVTRIHFIVTIPGIRWNMTTRRAIDAAIRAGRNKT